VIEEMMFAALPATFELKMEKEKTVGVPRV